MSIEEQRDILLKEMNERQEHLITRKDNEINYLCNDEIIKDELDSYDANHFKKAKKYITGRLRQREE